MKITPLALSLCLLSLLFWSQTEPFAQPKNLFPADVEDSTAVLEQYLVDVKAAEEEADKPKIAQRAYAAAVIYQQINNLEAAEKYYQKALMAAADIGDSETESNSLYQVAQIQFMEEDYESALTYFMRTEEALEHVDKPRELTTIYGGIGKTFLAEGRDSLALQFFKKALDNSRMENLDDLVPGCLVHLALVYEEMEKFPMALSYFEEALSLEREAGNDGRTIQILNQISDIYQKTKNAKESIDHAMQALDLSREQSDKKGMRKACTNLAMCYKVLGDYKKSLEFLEISMATKDSLFNAEKDLALANLAANYQIELQESENQRLKKDQEVYQSQLEQQRWRVGGLGLILLSALGFIALLYRMNNTRRKNYQKLAEQKQVLQAQAKELQEREQVQKHIEAALREREEMFRGFYEQSPLGIALFNEEKNHFTRCNQRLCDLLGYTEQEMQSKNLKDITHPEDVEADRKSFYQYIAGKGGEVYLREKRLLRKNGGVVWVNTAISLLKDDAGTLKSVIVMMSDITEEKQMQEDLHLAQAQLLQADKMASLGQLTAGLAHEINNPVNYIYTGIGGLEKNLAALMEVVKEYDSIKKMEDFPARSKHIQELKEDMDYDEVLEDISELMLGIREGAVRTEEIVRSLQHFSRTDRDVFTKSNIHEGVDSTLFILKNALQDNVQIDKNYAPNLTEIECYPGQLNQVFMNIISNAIHAIGNKEGCIEIQTQNTDQGIQIKIKDNGPGIPIAIQKRIFDPFFTTKEVGRGTGLGLSISYGIIKKHGGNIRMESEEGKGTCFEINLPKKQI